MARPKNKSAPKRRGRTPSTTSKSARIRELLATGMSPMDIAKEVGATPGLVYQIRGPQGGGKRRGPGRPRKAGKAAAGANGLGGILQAVQHAERERQQLRKALEQLRAIVDDVLA
ncbi:MAG: hypothetical protein AB7O97_10515 [Planctomycetota bacterium]